MNLKEQNTITKVTFQTISSPKPTSREKVTRNHIISYPRHPVKIINIRNIHKNISCYICKHLLIKNNAGKKGHIKTIITLTLSKLSLTPSIQGISKDRYLALIRATIRGSDINLFPNIDPSIESFCVSLWFVNST